MLIDLPAWLHGPNCPSTAKIAKAKEENPDFEFEFHDPRHMAKGVYESFLLDHDLSIADFEISIYPYGRRWMHTDDVDERLRIIQEDIKNDTPEDYGVCDDYQQVLMRWPQIESDERSLILAMSPITRESNPDWRWHKNGVYIGTQDPQAEHFGDEPVIEKVYMFRIIEILSIPVIAD